MRWCLRLQYELNSAFWLFSVSSLGLEIERLGFWILVFWYFMGFEFDVFNQVLG